MFHQVRYSINKKQEIVFTGEEFIKRLSPYVFFNSLGKLLITNKQFKLVLGTKFHMCNKRKKEVFKLLQDLGFIKRYNKVYIEIIRLI